MGPKYRQVISRAARETGRIMLAHSWAALAWKVFATLALLAVVFAFVRFTPAEDDSVFTDYVTWAILAGATAVILVCGTFFAQLLFIAPFQLWKAEWERAEDAERRCGELSGGGPVRDRISVRNAGLYMIFHDWEHSTEDLTVDHITLIAGHFSQMVQDAIDSNLDIWVKRNQHGGNHVNLGPDYWEDHRLDWGSLDGLTMMARSNSGSHLNETFDPLVRQSDIERLYGTRR